MSRSIFLLGKITEDREDIAISSGDMKNDSANRPKTLDNKFLLFASFTGAETNLIPMRHSYLLRTLLSAKSGEFAARYPNRCLKMKKDRDMSIRSEINRPLRNHYC